MPSAQQPMARTAVSGLNALLGNISSLGRQAQAIAGEFAKMSEENLGAGSKAAERLREARSLQEVTNIQTDLMKESYECTTSHYRKIAEIAASTPQEMARGYQELFSAVTEAGREAADRGADYARQATEEAGRMTQKGAEAVQRGGRG